MALSNFNDNIQIAAPKDIDNRRGKFFGGVWLPYTNVAEANVTVLPAYRSIGLTVIIDVAGETKEYWWKEGITDVDLIDKNPSMGGIVTAENGLSLSGANNVVLGGSLLNNTTITAGAFNFTLGKFTIYGTGLINLYNYGSGTFTGVATKTLQVDGYGNVIEGAVIGAYTASNGLTMTTNNTKLGGTLIDALTTIAADANQLIVTGTKSGVTVNDGILRVIQSTTGSIAIYAESPTGGTSKAIYGISTSGTGVYGVGAAAGVIGTSSVGSGVNANGTSNADALSAFSVDGVAGSFSTGPSSTNTIVDVLKVIRNTTGTAANGIGGSIDFYIQATSATTPLSNQIIYKWTDATFATRTSSLVFTGVNSTSTVDLLTLAGDGSMTMRPITATAASAITPAEGMIVMVSNTNGTFLSIGFWGYRNGAWAAF